MTFFQLICEFCTSCMTKHYENYKMFSSSCSNSAYKRSSQYKPLLLSPEHLIDWLIDGALQRESVSSPACSQVHKWLGIGSHSATLSHYLSVWGWQTAAKLPDSQERLNGLSGEKCWQEPGGMTEVHRPRPGPEPLGPTTELWYSLIKVQTNKNVGSMRLQNIKGRWIWILGKNKGNKRKTFNQK